MLAIVFANRTPGPLTEVGAPALPMRLTCAGCADAKIDDDCSYSSIFASRPFTAGAIAGR